MHIEFIGDTIRRARLAKKMTQERLVEGICSRVTLSRLENGTQTPSRPVLNAILERLDLPADRYYAHLTNEDIALDQFHKEIVDLNVKFERALPQDRPAIRAQALAVHRELERHIPQDDTISRQLILRSQILLGTEDGPYPPALCREMLLTALRLTSPDFSLDCIADGVYTVEEIKILNQIGNTYSDEQNHTMAVTLFAQLYDFIRNHYQNIRTVLAHLDMIAFNYGNALIGIKDYRHALEVAEEAKNLCLQFNKYAMVDGLLAIMAESYHFLGNDELSRELYLQSYYLCKITGDVNGLYYICLDAKKYLNLDLKPQGYPHVSALSPASPPPPPAAQGASFPR